MSTPLSSTSDALRALRALRTQIIRDRADEETAVDVDLAAELGRLDLELRLAMNDLRGADDRFQVLHTSLEHCRDAMSELADGALGRAQDLIAKIRYTLARWGDRPTEPPTSRTDERHLQ